MKRSLSCAPGILAACLLAPLRADEPLTSEWRTIVPRTGSGATDRRIPGLSDLTFAGPMPNDPFVLGDFAASERDWINSTAGIAPPSGENAAIQLFRGSDFELEGTMTHTGFGGWFLLVGWKETGSDTEGAAGGSGYCISNFTTRSLRSPWLLTEIRDGAAVPHRTAEYRSLDWQREQPFRLTVAAQRATLTVGRETALRSQRLPHYEGGGVILGAYRTAYGPKAIVLNSARVRTAPVSDPAAAPPQTFPLVRPPSQTAAAAVPDEFTRLDTSRVWKFNGRADYELLWNPRDPGRLRLISIHSATAKGFRHSAWLEQFDRARPLIVDGQPAWRCLIRFSHWSVTLPCLAQVTGDNQLRLAVREWDAQAGSFPKTAPEGFTDEGVLTFLGERTERDPGSALLTPNPLRPIESSKLQ